jgi:hypothetical protein
MVALRKAGITDLEELVKRVIGKVQDADEAVDVFAPVAEPPAGAPLTHRPPKIPFTVAGVTYDPADIKRFDRQPLHFVCRPRGDATERIGFVGNDWLRAIRSYAQLRQLGWLAAPAGYGVVYGGVAVYNYPPNYYPPPYSTYGPPGQVAAGISPGIEEPSRACRLYEDANFVGSRLLVRANVEVRDLTQISRGFLGLGDWNDIISSVRSDGATVLLYEHINFAADGDSLMIYPTEKEIYRFVNLAPLGWNDRVSSVQNFGKIY